MKGLVDFLFAHWFLSFVGFGIVLYLIMPTLLFFFRRIALKVLRYESKRFQVTNRTEKKIFVALFEANTLSPFAVSILNYVKHSKIVDVAPEQCVSLPIPKTWTWTGEIVIGWSFERVALLKEGANFPFRALGVGVGKSQMKFEFRYPTIARHFGSAQLYTALECVVQDKLEEAVRAKAKHYAPKDEKSDPSLKREVKVVRLNKGVCEEEKNWLKARQRITRNALQNLLKVEASQLHSGEIAFLSSGGGCRAMVGYWGAMDGLNEQGILDSMTYMATSSGSCWGLSVLMRVLQLHPELSSTELIAKVYEEAKENMQRPLFPSAETISDLVFTSLSRKLRYRQSLSLVDVYGAIISYRVPTSPTLSSQAECLQSGSVPLPLYTTARLDAVKDVVRTEEFSPFCVTLNDYAIPPWGLGRFFDGMKSCESFTPEVPLSELLGIFGSAFCTTVEKIVENAFWMGGLGANFMESFLKASRLGLGERVQSVWNSTKSGVELVAVKNRSVATAIPMIYPTHLNSWTFDSRSKKHTPATVPFFDGGIDCNMPWRVVLRRDVRVILALDHSDDTYGPEGFFTLKGLEQLSKTNLHCVNGLKFPSVDPTTAHTRKISVYGDPKKGEIVVVYIPTKPFLETDFDIESSCKFGFCNTANFVFKPEQFDLLYGLNKSNMRHHREAIVSAIASAFLKK